LQKLETKTQSLKCLTAEFFEIKAITTSMYGITFAEGIMWSVKRDTRLVPKSNSVFLLKTFFPLWISLFHNM